MVDNNNFINNSNSSSSFARIPRIGVLSVQGAFVEHQRCLEELRCETQQVRVPSDLENLDGIVFPGGESTAMGLIIGGGSGSNGNNMWDALKDFVASGKPTWGTCAGMILLSNHCIGTSAVIENNQRLMIGGLNVLVCRNYFGSQISSFEMETPPPPLVDNGDNATQGDTTTTFPGIFIRAPAILYAGHDVTVLGKVVATPCRQAAAVLQELDQGIASGRIRIQLENNKGDEDEEKKEVEEENNSRDDLKNTNTSSGSIITLPGAAEGTNAREVICAVRKDSILCTAFHPELTNDLRWHSYFLNMVLDRMRTV
jgi:5'-phosphate synthase pdxT subunit